MRILTAFLFIIFLSCSYQLPDISSAAKAASVCADKYRSSVCPAEDASAPANSESKISNTPGSSDEAFLKIWDAKMMLL